MHPISCIHALIRGGIQTWFIDDRARTHLDIQHNTSLHISSRSVCRSAIRIPPLSLSTSTDGTNGIQNTLEPDNILVGHIRMEDIPPAQLEAVWEDISIAEQILEIICVGCEGSLVAAVAGGEGVEVWEFDQHDDWRGEVL